MEGRNQHCRAVRVHAPTQAADRLLGAEEALRGDAAEREDHLGLGRAKLCREYRGARRELLGLRIPVAGWAAVVAHHARRHVRFVFLNPDVIESEVRSRAPRLDRHDFGLHKHVFVSVVSEDSPENLFDGVRLIDNLGPPEIQQQIAVRLGQPVLDRRALLGSDIGETGPAHLDEDVIVRQTEIVQERRTREGEQVDVGHAEPIEDRFQFCLAEARHAPPEPSRDVRGERDTALVALVGREVLDLRKPRRYELTGAFVGTPGYESSVSTTIRVLCLHGDADLLSRLSAMKDALVVATIAAGMVRARLVTVIMNEKHPTTDLALVAERRNRFAVPDLVGALPHASYEEGMFGSHGHVHGLAAFVLARSDGNANDLASLRKGVARSDVDDRAEAPAMRQHQIAQAYVLDGSKAAGGVDENAWADEALDRIRDVHLVPREVHARRLQHLGEELARAADERKTLRVLVGARPLADHHELRPRMAGPEDDRRAPLAELAFAAALERPLLGGERFLGREEVGTLEGQLGRAEVAVVAEGGAEGAERLGKRLARVGGRHRSLGLHLASGRVHRDGEHTGDDPVEPPVPERAVESTDERLSDDRDDREARQEGVEDREA